MTKRERLIDVAARAIFDAPERLSGDHIGDLICSSDMLYPSSQHLRGHATSEAYRLAAMEVCAQAATAALDAILRELGEPSEEMVEAAMVTHPEWRESQLGRDMAEMKVGHFRAMLGKVGANGGNDG